MPISSISSDEVFFACQLKDVHSDEKIGRVARRVVRVVRRVRFLCLRSSDKIQCLNCEKLAGS